MELDLTEAIEAAKKTRAYEAGVTFDVPAIGVALFTKLVVEAAAPIIERQVTTRFGDNIAAEYRDRGGSLTCVDSYTEGFLDALARAESIARGGK